jgi:predicted phosphodiesterase
MINTVFGSNLSAETPSRVMGSVLPSRLPCPRNLYEAGSAPPGITILIISDTHNTHLSPSFPRMPPADIIIHGGDFSSTGTYEDIDSFVTWFKNLRQYKKRICIAGNHEVTLDKNYYVDRGHARFHARLVKSDPAEYSMRCRNALEVPEIVYLEDSSVELHTNEFSIRNNDIHLESDSAKSGGGSSNNNSNNSSICGNDDTGDDISGSNKVDDSILCYGSPYSSFFCDWGFNVRRGAPSQQKWASIPDLTDILITHGPPYGYGDKCDDGFVSGCEDLLKLITDDSLRPNVRPRLHIFGHIHEDYGTFYNGKTLFVNGSTCSLRYRPTNPPILVFLPFDKSLSASLVDY